MAITPDKRHVNCDTVVWTPDGADGTPGTPIPWTGVQTMGYDPRGELIAHSGDGDIYATTKAFVGADPQLTFQFRDLNAARQAVPGQRGSISANVLGARNRAAVGGGGFTVAMANAIIENTPMDVNHRQFADARVMVSAESEDGITSPVTFTAL